MPYCVDAIVVVIPAGMSDLMETERDPVQRRAVPWVVAKNDTDSTYHKNLHAQMVARSIC
jgi:hypothetical protein